MLFSKLRSYLGQHHIGLLALFVALGGSAYAGAKIRSQNVADDSLTGADIRGHAAKGRTKFVEGSLTGDDIRGSAGAGKRKAVDGSLTGDDVKNGSLTAADLSGNSITGAIALDGSLTGADVANDSLTGADILESSLGTVPKASDADTIAGLGPQSFATVLRTNQQNTGGCDVPAQMNECAPITITVPAGRHYRAVVWSSASVAQAGGGAIAVYFCPAIRNVSGAGPKRCLSKTGAFADSVSVAAGSYGESMAASGDTEVLGASLGPGVWTLSTVLQPDTALTDHQALEAHTTVLIADAGAPGLPGVPDTTCCTSSTSGGGSSGTSSGGSSGTSSGGSSGASSGGSSGTSSG